MVGTHIIHQMSHIKSLKRNKSTVPNGIYLEANTRKIYIQAMNKVYDREVIPSNKATLSGYTQVKEPKENAVLREL